MLAAALPYAAKAASSIAAKAMENKKDPERFKQNEAWAASASQGDANALLALKYMTGDYGATTIPGIGPASGWATDAAKSHARQLYSQVIAGNFRATPLAPAPSLPPLGLEAKRLSERMDAVLSTADRDTRTALADTAQRVGAGAGTAAAQAIDGDASRVTVPISGGMLLVGAIVVVAVLLATRGGK